MLHYRYFVAVNLFSKILFETDVTNSPSVTTKGNISRRPAMPKRSNLIHEITNQKIIMHWENELPIKKQLQCKHKPSKTPTKPNQAIPHLFCPFQTPLLAAIWGELCHRGSPFIQYLYTASLQSNPPELRDTGFLHFYKKEKPLSQEANLLFTWPLSAEVAALPLGVSSSNGHELPCLLNVKHE